MYTRVSENSRKYLLILFAVITAMMLAITCYVLPVNAMDNNEQAQEQIVTLKDGTFLKTETEVEALEAPQAGANVVMTFPAGSTLFVTDTLGDYYEITYQGKTLYVANGATVNEEKMDIDTLKQEGIEGKADIEKQINLDIQYEQEQSQSKIWAGVLIGLVVVVFAIGVIMTLSRNAHKKRKRRNTR